MKRISDFNTGSAASAISSAASSLRNFRIPKLPFGKRAVLKVLLVLAVLVVIFLIAAYFFLIGPLLGIAAEARQVKDSTYLIKKGMDDLNFTEIEEGLKATSEQLQEFEQKYEKKMSLTRKLPGVESYYQDSQHILTTAKQGIELGSLAVRILKPHASDLGFSTNGGTGANLPAEERVVKLLALMPEFAPEVAEISNRMSEIDQELGKIDASKYPRKMPGFVKLFGVNPDINLREQILSIQGISSELADKAPQFETLFNAIPEFMGLNEPKKYMIIMANNYEIRMTGGFNTYIALVELDKGVPQITFAIDTYFIDEGDRTGSSHLVSRNVDRFLQNYLYIQGRSLRLYARDATSTRADFPAAADRLLSEFWKKDLTLPQDLDGVIQINNDIAVDLLEVVGPVNTEKFSVLTDQGTYITIPITEFNSENVIVELENVAGGKLAETLGRKEIIKFLAQSIFEKVYGSEATNLVSIASVMLDSLSKKDVIMYSFDQNVEKAFEALGYAGRLRSVPESWDYLYVNRSNFGSGKADWTADGFVTSVVKKDVQVKNGKPMGTVEVTIKNPKRPSWYNIDPCCFYRAYLRIYPAPGSKLISVTASDGQDPNALELTDETTGQVFFESFTVQEKESDLTVTFEYELPPAINLDDYHVLVQRQPGTSSDSYEVSVEGVGEQFLLNSDKEISL